MQNRANRLAQLWQFIHQPLQQPGKTVLRCPIGRRARTFDTNHQINRPVLQMQPAPWQQCRSRGHARPFRA
jgi:hypothetical protein